MMIYPWQAHILGRLGIALTLASIVYYLLSYVYARIRDMLGKRGRQ